MSYSIPRIDHMHLTDCFTVSRKEGGGYLPCASADWTLFCVRQGKACVTIVAQTVHVHGGEFLLLPPQSCHSVDLEDDSCLTVCCFEGLRAPLPETYCRLSADDTAAALPILSLLDVGGLHEQVRDRVLEALLLQLVSLSGFYFSEPPVSSLPLRILRYLNDHFCENLSLNDLADAFHISISHIIHIFNPLFGLSPIQYLIRRRIGEAQMLLRRTGQRASEIAAQVGIFNRNYFYRTFKRLTGLSPSQYRDMVCENRSEA